MSTIRKFALKNFDNKIDMLVAENISCYNIKSFHVIMNYLEFKHI